MRTCCPAWWLCSALCGDPNGKETQRRGEAGMHTADSLCYTAEINTAL